MSDVETVDEEADVSSRHSPARPEESPRNHGETFKFHVLYTELFNPLTANLKKPTGAQVVRGRKAGPDGLPSLTPHERRREIINRFFSRWRLEVGDNIYPALRLILPDKDKERAMYGLKEKALAKILVKLMKIDKNSEDAYNLINWKRPGQTSDTAGDFAGRVLEVLSKRALRIEPGNLTIQQVNDMLGELSVETKEGRQANILERFYQQMNAEEMMWLIRIILRNMRVGATEKTFLEIWHPDAEALFNVCSSLRRVCQELYRPEIRLEKEDRGVALMACYQPQFAFFNEKKQSSFSSMVASMKPTEDDQEFWIEEKLDGERMQMHMVLAVAADGNDKDEEGEGSNPDDPKRTFKFWSRKAKDYTYLYGASLDDPNSSLTRHLKDAFADGVENIILDGEMITWDPELDVMVPFGSLKTAALAESKDPYAGGIRPYYRVFDVLFLNNTDLTRYTLRDRRRALEASIKPVHRRMEILEHTVGKAAEDIEKRLQVVIENASEGLLLKNPRSSYRLNERNDDWVKVKPEYMNEFGESLDCIIIGGYYGSGHRGGVLGSYLCGLRDDRQSKDLEKATGKGRSEAANESNAVPKFLSFFKVGGGMTRDEYKTIQHKTEGKWHDWDPKRPPFTVIELAGGAKQIEKPDQWIHPLDSLVVEVKAASVNPTEDYATGVTLRFPRFAKFRPDKDWRTALGVQEFRNLKETVEAQHESNLQMAAAERRPEKGRSAKLKKPLTVAGYNARAVNNVQKIRSQNETGSVFHGLTFFIMTECSAPQKSKLELEELIKAHGGKIVQSPDIKSEDKRTNTSVICVAERRTVKVASLIKRGANNIIKPAWLFDCIEQARVDLAKGLRGITIPYEPERHLFFAPEDNRKLYELNADRHGDSYTRDSTVEELKSIMATMGRVKTITDQRYQDAETAIPNDPEDSRGNMFATLRIYFYMIASPKADDLASSSASESSLPRKRDRADDEATDANTMSNFSPGMVNTLSKARRKATFGQASIAKTLSDPNITHIVIISSGTDRTAIPSNTTDREHHNQRLKALRQELVALKRRQQHKRIPRIVSVDWIEECWNENTRLNEERYPS